MFEASGCRTITYGDLEKQFGTQNEKDTLVTDWRRNKHVGELEAKNL